MTSRGFPTPAAARRLLAALGVALSLAAIWLDPLSSDSATYWDDHSAGVFLLATTTLCAALLAGSVAPRRRMLLGLAGAAGAALWGFYLFLPVFNAFDRLGDIGAGGWLGVAGAGLIVLGAAPVGGSVRGAGRGSEPARVAGARLLAGAGFVLVAGSLWFTTLRFSDGSISYWSFAGRHSIGILMLMLAAAGLLVVGIGAVTRLLVLEALAIGLALLLFGLAAWYPIVLAVDELDTVRPGGWLTVAGSIVAVAAASATFAFERRMVGDAQRTLPPPPLETDSSPAAD
ncbi:MAG: hypothetical protein ACXVY3_08910 [Gaiellaceae bacterium]